jgi:hypothetical protein
MNKTEQAQYDKLKAKWHACFRANKEGMNYEASLVKQLRSKNNKIMRNEMLLFLMGIIFGGVLVVGVPCFF